MRIPSWIAKLIPNSWKSPNNNNSLKQEVALNFRHYPELRDLQRAGATQEQLAACQRGFELLEEHGQATAIEQVAEKCIPIILRAPKATPEHLSVFFDSLIELKACGVHIKQRIELAKAFRDAIENGAEPKDLVCIKLIPSKNLENL